MRRKLKKRTAATNVAAYIQKRAIVDSIVVGFYRVSIP